MSRWVQCAGCGLRHRQRPDQRCPRCQAHTGDSSDIGPAPHPGPPFGGPGTPPVGGPSVADLELPPDDQFEPPRLERDGPAPTTGGIEPLPPGYAPPSPAPGWGSASPSSGAPPPGFGTPPPAPPPPSPFGTPLGPPPPPAPRFSAFRDPAAGGASGPSVQDTIGAGRLGLAIGLGTLVAGACGYLWYTVAANTGYEIGYAAWGLGLVVGLVVKLSIGDASESGAAISLACAGGGLLLGKFLIALWIPLTPDMEGDEDIALLAVLEQMRPDVPLAEVLASMMVEGRIDDPALQELLKDQATIQAAAAEVQYMDEPTRKAAVADFIDRAMGHLSWYQLLKASLGPLDLLWFGLALFTAWKVGGSSGDLD